MIEFHITNNAGGFRLHAKDGERGAGVLINSAFMQEALGELLGTLEALKPRKPADDPKDGPCCHEQNEDGLWICTGCTCQNIGDAQSAASWADDMNRWLAWSKAAPAPSITLTPAEVQSGLDRVRFAENLIRQLPEDHDGRNTWLMNYGQSPT